MTNNWQEVAAGDKEAFMHLYKSLYQSLFAYGYSLTSDRELTKDCIQELFVELWNTRASLNKDVKNIRSYLFTWLRRKISHELVHERKIKSSDSIEVELTEASYEELLVSFQQTEEKKEKLRSALQRLSKKQLEIIRLKFFDNLSYRAIAEQTALTPRTVYNLIYEALKQLRQSMRLVLFGF